LAARLQADSGESLGREIAQFHCELAAQALAGQSPQRLEIAAREIGAARLADPDHPRPWLLRGELDLAEGDPQAAIAAWRPVLERKPAYAALMARGWLKAHEILGQLDEGIAALEAAHRLHPGVDTLAAIADALAGSRGAVQALNWADEQLRNQPSLLGLEKLLGLRKAAAGGQADPDRDLTQQLIAPQARRLSRYVCMHCGFKARQFYWQCPGCSRWDTYAPKRGEELEAGR
jgi:lipopolysaccharide biosynthesis regulator YciM